MAIYLAEGGGSDRLLGLSCRHVLIGSKELENIDYVYRPGDAPRKKVLLLGQNNHTDLVNSIKVKIEQLDTSVSRLRVQIRFREMKLEEVTNAVNAEDVRAALINARRLLDEAERQLEAWEVLLNQVNKGWKKLNDRVLGHIIRSPAIALKVGEYGFTEDWGIFSVNRAKLGDGFQGNKIDLGAF